MLRFLRSPNNNYFQNVQNNILSKLTIHNLNLSYICMRVCKENITEIY